MTKHIDVYVTLSSPWTFLGWDRCQEIARRHGATVAYFPLDFTIVFPATGGVPLPKRAPARLAYRLAELRRWKAYLGADRFNIEPKHFPVDARQASLLAIAARERGRDIGPLCRAILSAVWCEERDIADRATLQAIAGACGLDGAALLAAADAPEIAERFKADSEAAIGRDVFGAPTYVYKDEVFWGQDRLDFLDRALAAA
jgi:carboxymethylenebutenolidase